MTNCDFLFIYKIEIYRNASESNEHHDGEISSARATAEVDVSKNSEDIIKHIEGNLGI